MVNHHLCLWYVYYRILSIVVYSIQGYLSIDMVRITFQSTSDKYLMYDYGF